MSPRQCKAARALLGWKQDKLAVKAGISKRTVVRFESGEPATVEANRLLIQKTFEAVEGLQAYTHEKLAFEWVMNVQNIERRTVLFLLLSVIGADSTKLQKELLESALERLRGMMTAEAS